jgi:hypothetical protein
MIFQQGSNEKIATKCSLKLTISNIFEKECAILGRKSIKKYLNKFDPWVSIFKQSRWLCYENVYLFFFGTTCGTIMFSSSHWHNYFLQPRQAVLASA